MNTPVCDFVRNYAGSDPVRLHMPGHKGRAFLGCEAWDMTEIDGADTLYLPRGIIRESEQNASRLFGCETFYSAEGSSLCIRAMLYLAMRHTGIRRVLAGRNAHRTLLTAAALLDLDLRWLAPQPEEGYCACTVTAQTLERALQKEPVGAVYITSPDYYGSITDIAALSAVCRRYGALLLVDNAHGAYLHFLPQPCHPADLGADLCCDSAHKTLPVLTGGAYLHLGSAVRDALSPCVKDAMALFGSTSPSYLILQSLDNANVYLETFRQKLAAFLPKTAALKAELQSAGFTLCGAEPLKITIRAADCGYTGDALAGMLAAQSVFCEMHDAEHLVAMLTPENSDADLRRFSDALRSVPKRDAIARETPPFRAPQIVCSVRQALFSPAETLPVEQCVGRVCALPPAACPPCVPIVLSGERIDGQAAQMLLSYGVTECSVMRETHGE